jgi:hypothetical protein
MEMLILFIWWDSRVLFQQVDEGGAHQSRTDRLEEPRDIFGSIDLFYVEDWGPLRDRAVRHIVVLDSLYCT